MTDKSNIYTKISAVQNEIGVLSKDADNPFFKSKYLTLDKIIANLLPLLNKNRLCLVQLPMDNMLVTHVADMDSDAYIKSECKLQCPDGDPQKQGSAITYARRYSLGCIFLIQTEEDDDGNRASNIQTPVSKPSGFKNTKASDKQIGKLRFELSRTGVSMRSLMENYQVANLTDLSSKQASEAIEQLVNRPARKA